MSPDSYAAQAAALSEELARAGLPNLAATALGIALGVRRVERALDEIVADAAEDEKLLSALHTRAGRAARRRAPLWVVEGGRK